MFETKKNGVVCILGGDQPLNLETIEQATTCCHETLQLASPKLVVDMSKVPLVDSRGLEWLLDTLDACTKRGGNMVIASPTPLCREIISVTIVADQCAVYDDLLSAIGSFSQ